MKFRLGMLWDEISDRFSLVSFAIVLLYGFFGKYLPFDFNNNSAFNWEDASIITTFIFTVLLYIKGYFKSDDEQSLFNGFSNRKKGLIPILVLIVAVLTFILMWHMYKGHTLDRHYNMLILLIIAIILSWIDYQIGQNDDIKEVLSRRYHTIFYISDLPITVTMGFLLLYSVIINAFDVKNDAKNMDTFFSGAIAFQLLISLLLWSFADNITLKIVNNSKK